MLKKILQYYLLILVVTSMAMAKASLSKLNNSSGGASNNTEDIIVENVVVDDNNVSGESALNVDVSSSNTINSTTSLQAATSNLGGTTNELSQILASSPNKHINIIEETVDVNGDTIANGSNVTIDIEGSNILNAQTNTGNKSRAKRFLPSELNSRKDTQVSSHQRFTMESPNSAFNAPRKVEFNASHRHG